MAASTKKVHQVAVVIYNGCDILDFAGPVEMLTHVYYNLNPRDPELAFNIKLVAETHTIRSGGALTLTADMTLEEAGKRLNEFDIVIVPGGPPKVCMALVDRDSPEVQWLRSFATHGSPERGGEERVILSVCTGALLLGATGAVGGLRLTTHHLAYDLLRQVCQKAANGGKTADVVETNPHKRYVDGGISSTGIRVLTAGGISCGLDASLYLAALKIGEPAADFTAELTEYEWKRAV